MSLSELTACERDIYDWIKAHAASGLPCPSNADIAHRLGFSSMSSGVRMISKLEQRGVISVQRSRTTRVITFGDGSGALDRGHARLGRYGTTYTPRKSAVSASIAEPAYTTRDPCTYCGTRGDIGCKHRRWA